MVVNCYAGRGTGGQGTPVPRAKLHEVTPLLYSEYVATPEQIEQMLAKYDCKCKPPYQRIYHPSKRVNLQTERRSKKRQ